MNTTLRIRELEEQIRYHADLYFNQSGQGQALFPTKDGREVLGPSAITDAEYDALVDELKQLAPDSAVLAEVGAIPSYGRKVKHETPMGSLEKAKTNDEVWTWAQQYTTDLMHDPAIAVTPKIDGIAVRIGYDKGRLKEAATRGNGEVGQDVTDNVKAMHAVPKTLSSGFSGEVRCEVYMSKESFRANNAALERAGEKLFANPRNAANGSLTCQDPRVTAQRGLDLFWHDVIPADGTDFETESEKRAYGAAQLDGIPAVEIAVVTVQEFGTLALNWERRRPDLPFEIDGLVLALMSLGDQDDAGYTGKNPLGKLAFKFKPEQTTSIVKAIDYQVGRTGRLTPVCRIESTYLAGSTISNLTLHNYGRVKELGIAVGDEILFEKAGDIIPQVVRVTQKNSPVKHHEAPGTCPSCDSVPHIDDGGVNLWCGNPACPAKLEERVLHWLKRLDILGIGPTTVHGLCDTGQVKDLPDLYYLDQHNVRAVTGGDRAAHKVVMAIMDKNEIPLDVFLSGLGIDGLGRTTSKAVAKQYKTLDNIRALVMMANTDSYADLASIEGVGSLSASKIVGGLKQLDPCINRLVECIDVMDVQDATGPLAGKTFCLTGSMPSGKKRAEVVAIIEAAGGEFKSSVGKGLSYLIMADPSSNSSKAVKARKLGTECISEERLMEMIG